MSVALRIEDLHKSFGDHEVLCGIDLEVDAAEVVCVIGPSGSGKSTMLRCINRLEEPTSGRLFIGDTDITAIDSERELDLHRREVGMVFQQFNLFPTMTALENVAVGPVQVLSTEKREAELQARELLESVGLADKADAYASKLSGGQQQRVAIARALAMQPQAMLFDEVTSALDPELVDEVLAVLRKLANEGMTMIIVTHEIGFAGDVGDRIVFMDDGAIVEVGPAASLLASPREERTRRFLRRVLRESEARTVGSGIE